MSVFSKMSNGCCIIRQSSEIGPFLGKEAKKYMLSVDSYSCPPLVVFPKEMDSSESAFVVFPLAVISALLKLINYTKILPRVVQAVSVFVVTFARVFVLQTKNLTVHHYLTTGGSFAYATIANCIIGPCGVAPACVPSKSRKFGKVDCRNLRHLSLRQRNFDVIFGLGHPQSSLSSVSWVLEAPDAPLYLGGA